MYLILPVLLPAVFGLVLAIVKLPDTRRQTVYTFVASLISGAVIWYVICTDTGGAVTLIKASDTVAIRLKFDGLGKIFAGLIATLWPLTTLYAIEYMKRDENVRTFCVFFLLSMAATAGIAESGDMLSMYFFYELLTLTTLPLILHGMSDAAKRAGISYVCYSLGGAALAFIAVAFSTYYGGGEFRMGGSLAGEAFGNQNLALTVYALSAVGFGVKAAIFPLHRWLPQASVAPTPVTALLHAVAVVKAGAFAVMRLTYYCFGADRLHGTWAQTALTLLAAFTILYGSTMALKERHFKRRLAYSTCANLSYILFGAFQMSAAGLAGGVVHLLYHSMFKICGFFAVGAVMHNTGREYVDELDGLGRKMPVTFACFTVSGLALLGTPLFNGFASKWHLAVAAMETGTAASFFGFAALLYSALLGSIYMLTVSVRAFLPAKDAPVTQNDGIKEVNLLMTFPMVLLAVSCLITGMCDGAVMGAIRAVLGV